MRLGCSTFIVGFTSTGFAGVCFCSCFLVSGFGASLVFTGAAFLVSTLAASLVFVGLAFASAFCVWTTFLGSSFYTGAGAGAFGLGAAFLNG